MSKFLEGLNDRQKEAVEYLGGPLLVLAGAGSGKTRVLTYKIAYLIEQDFVKPWEILAITFTNKAAREMKERALSLDDRVKDVWLGTFHSVCVRILKREIECLGFSTDFNIIDEQDKEKVLKDIIKRMNLDDKKFVPKSVGYEISNAKNDIMFAKDYEDNINNDYRKEVIAKIYNVYESEMKKCNTLDFDDLLLLTFKIFHDFKDKLSFYQNRFKYILVDEYQDTNRLQFLLVSMIASYHGNICVVGDESQSIYGFRGADISNILDFENNFKEAKIIKLEQNYRSTKNILSAANELIKNNKNKIDKNLWTSNETGDRIKYYEANNEYDEVDYIVDKIDDICKKEDKKYSDFAVLYRTNAQSRVIEDVFMRNGTPYKLIGGLKFYSRKEIKDIVSYLKFIQNTNDNIAFKRIINVPKRGIGDVSVSKLEFIATSNNLSCYDAIKYGHHRDIRGYANYDLFIDVIDKLINMKNKVKISELILNILELTGYNKILEEGDKIEAETRLQNIMEFIGVAKEFENENVDNTLADFLDSIALVTDTDSINDDNNVVTLMTMHCSKGLEYDYVFLVGLEEGLFPSNRSVIEDGEVEEERRLMYVGITRAKKKLFLTSAKKRTLYGSTNYTIPSRFISEIPDELFDEDHKKRNKFSMFLNNEYGESNKINSFNDSNKVNNYFEKKKTNFGISVDSFLKSNFKNNDLYTNNEKDMSSYNVGVKVKHKKFGIGIIMNREVSGDDVKLEIDFENYGFKRLMANYTPLEIIE